MRAIHKVQLDKVRPAVLLTREAALGYFAGITIAPITSTRRGLASEVPAGGPGRVRRRPGRRHEPHRRAGSPGRSQPVFALGVEQLPVAATSRSLALLEPPGGGAGCTRGPGHALIPHHATPWAANKITSVADTVLLCEQTHHDLHTGKKTIRLQDRRWLNEQGWAERPSRG